MKVDGFKIIKIASILASIQILSCMKVLNAVGGDNPCWQAYIERKKLKTTTDTFERSQIEMQIRTYDELCRQCNQDAAPIRPQPR